MSVPTAYRDAAARASPLRIWDGDPAGCPAEAETLLWQGAVVGAGRRTIIEYLEKRADTVRERYLAWIHDLGELQVLGRKLRDRFRAHDGASLWAQSLFVEQSTWKQPSLQNGLKLMALELLLDAERPSRVELTSADRALSAALMNLCLRRGISCKPIPQPADLGSWATAAVARAGGLGPIWARRPRATSLSAAGRAGHCQEAAHADLWTAVQLLA